MGERGDVRDRVEEILSHNRDFVRDEAWREHAAAGRPARHLAIVTCMDTRLTRLLPDALGLANGDAVIVKVAGATIVDPYGEAMRSLLVAVGELGVDTIMVVGHSDCGACGMGADDLLGALERAGVPRERVDAALCERPDARDVLSGFACLENEVRKSVAAIRSHPLMPEGVAVLGFTIDVHTGELSACPPAGAGDGGAASR